MRLGLLAQPIWVGAPTLLLLTACWMRAEQQMMERSETMEGHLLALFDAVSAVQDEDDKRFKDAMHDLEKGGELPGVVTAGALEELHAAAARLRKLDDRPSRAKGLMYLAADCSSCHTTHDVHTPAMFDPERPIENALGGIVWKDEARWNDGWAKVGGGTPSPPDWAGRRAALEKVLAGEGG